MTVAALALTYSLEREVLCVYTCWKVDFTLYYVIR